MKRSRYLSLFCVFFLAAASAVSAQEPPAARWQDFSDGVQLQRDVEYGKAGDRSLKLDLMRPKKESDRLRPAIVFIHGGGWRAGNKSAGLGRILPFVASGKYVGATVAYRLSGEAIWPAQIHDCKAAIRWIRANAGRYGIDPKRIGVWGISAGGHLVALLGTSGGVTHLEGASGSADALSRVACVVDYCGPTDFPSFAEQLPDMAKPDSVVWQLFGGTVKEKMDVAKAASPITHVDKSDPPFLIVHGTRDPLVPIAQAENFHAALTKAGVDSTYIKMIDGRHVPGGEEIARRVTNFFDKHLLGKDVEASGEPIEL